MGHIAHLRKQFKSINTYDYIITLIKRRKKNIIDFRRIYCRFFIWTNLNPLHPRMLCAKIGWNWPSGSEEEDENVKSLQTDRQTDGRTDGQTDAGRQVIRKAHLSFQLRWAKNTSLLIVPSIMILELMVHSVSCLQCFPSMWQYDLEIWP